jgi:predicted AAA+ superfamily ATPase
MTPMSFGEFLDAKGEENLRNYLKNLTELINIPESLHEKLNELIRKYFLIGGMPAVVKEYVKSHDILKCQKIQHQLVNTFIEDFAKYARISKHSHLKKVFNAIPTLIGNKFVYSKIDTIIKSRELKEATELLEQAGILYRIRQTSGAGIPLEAGVKDNFFKPLFLDIGLLHALSGIYSETARQKDFTAIYNGAVAEQFSGQELIAYQNAEIKPSLFYWVREHQSGNAEVDYLIVKNTDILPIEIKSGSKGAMKSLLMFIEKYRTVCGVKISQAKYSISAPIINLPFYAIESFLVSSKNTF